MISLITTNMGRIDRGIYNSLKMNNFKFISQKGFIVNNVFIGNNPINNVYIINLGNNKNIIDENFIIGGTPTEGIINYNII